MNQYTRKTTWMGAGLLLALTCGAPAVADDTEIFLLTPADIAARPKPNVLFILDSSGSMDTNEETVEAYDYTEEYSGSCNRDRYYWTTLGVVPTCDASNIQYVNDAAFKCVAGDRRIRAVGSYTNLMAQHRTGTSGFGDAPADATVERWQALEPGNATDPVECLFDRDKHGDGTAGEVFAQKGGGLAPFTSVEADEVAWGSWPTSQSVTVYDGNYLNYANRTNPPTVSKSRNAILEEVTKIIVDAIENVNVGIMHFNQGSNTLRRQGGVVVDQMQDLDANRDDIKTAIDAIPHQGATPLSETLFEAALYWRGQAAYYGDGNSWTNASALASTGDPDVYAAPVTQSCAKNFNVVLSDGQPTRDQEVPSLLSRLPDWAATVGKTTCTTTLAYDDDDDTDLLPSGACLDEIAEYLSKKDISTQTGDQLVTTHTIGFTQTIPSLQEAATASGGEYFEARDIVTLTNAMLEIFDRVTDQSLSFAAPAVAVNTFNRTQNLNDLYLTTFGVRGSVHWPGNLKKYRITGGKVVDELGNDAVNPDDGFFLPSASSFWSNVVDGNDVEKGGAVAQLPTPANRDLYTNISSNIITDATNQLVATNASAFSLTSLGLTGAADEPSKEDLINWARGVDVRDEDNDTNTTEARKKTMGDPLHSQPAAVVYGGTAANPDVTVFTATNDGYLHAINGATGEERWAFIPRELLPNLPKLYFDLDSSFKNYGIDGDIVPVVFDADEDGIIESADNDFVYIIFGMRRGGGTYYALDVTDKETPKVLWRYTASGVSQSWSTPTVARIDIDDNRLNDQKAVVVFGGGYDTAHDTITHPGTDDNAGAGIYFLDLVTGQRLWEAGRAAAAELTLPAMKRAIPGKVSVLDINGDGFADRMYAADMGGQILRFDIYNGMKPNGIGTSALVTGGVIAQLGAQGLASPIDDADTRRFYTSPDISLFNDNVQNRRYLAISIGSGYRAHPLDNSTSERFYSVRDKNVFNQLNQDEYDALTLAPITEANLVEVGGAIGATIPASKAGWQFTLPNNQKVLSTSVTFNDEVFFVAFSPDTVAAAACAAGLGSNFLYRVTVSNGDPVIDLSTIVPTKEDEARRTTLGQVGIAPSPRFLFPSGDAGCTGSACSPPPITCVGVECFSPGFDNDPVRTLWTRDGIE